MAPVVRFLYGEDSTSVLFGFTITNGQGFHSVHPSSSYSFNGGYDFGAQKVVLVK